METAVGVDWDALIRDEMNWAIEQKQKDLRDDEFRMRVKVVGPNGEIADTPILWRNEEEKHMFMRAVSRVAKMTSSQAVVVTTDARFLNLPNFCKRFGIEEPKSLDKESLDAFNRRREEVMKGFDYYMGNLPSDCYFDNLMVFVRGPRVSRMSSTRYRIADGQITFDPIDEHRDGKLTINVIPAWWN